jgi:hypothetical protein
MASIFLGLDDVEFVRPTAAQLAHRTAVLFNSDTLALRTPAGAVTVTLARDRAPETSIQVARFFDAGALNGARVTTAGQSIRIAIPLTIVTQRLLQPLRAETGLQHHAGTISYCVPETGSREIVLSVARQDGADAQCTAFGRIDGIDALAISPSVSVAAR